MPLLIFIAQQVADPISGGAGWVGAGLLGLVLGWLLLVHLPAKDKQLKDLLELKDKQFTVMQEAKDKQFSELLEMKDAQLVEQLRNERTTVQAMGKDYRDGLRDVVKHCEEESARNNAEWRQQMNNIVAAVQDMAEKVDVIRFPKQTNSN